MQRIRIILFLQIAMSGIVFAQVSPVDSIRDNGKPSYFTDEKFPNILLTALSGKSYQLSDLKGQIVVLNWWFTTCSPCQDEIPELNELVHKFKGSNIRFISIARNKKLELQKYLNGNVFNYEQTLYTEPIYQLLKDYFPRNLILNKNGVVVFDRIGYSALNANEMTEKLEELLKQK